MDRLLFPSGVRIQTVTTERCSLEITVGFRVKFGEAALRTVTVIEKKQRKECFRRLLGIWLFGRCWLSLRSQDLQRFPPLIALMITCRCVYCTFPSLTPVFWACEAHYSGRSALSLQHLQTTWFSSCRTLASIFSVLTAFYLQSGDKTDAKIFYLLKGASPQLCNDSSLTMWSCITSATLMLNSRNSVEKKCMLRCCALRPPAPDFKLYQMSSFCDIF